MAVDSCSCRGVSFEDLSRLAEREKLDAEDLCARSGCGDCCGLCVAYIRVMLKTGVTDLPILDADDYRKIMSGEATLAQVARRGPPAAAR